jgi:hypothetical protein
MDEDFISGSGGMAPQVEALVVPALRKVREGRGTLAVGDVSEIKGVGRPSASRPGAAGWRGAPHDFRGERRRHCFREIRII